MDYRTAGVGIYEAPFRSKFFSVPVGMSAGKPETLGVCVLGVTAMQIGLVQRA